MDLRYAEGLVITERKGNRKRGPGRRRGGKSLQDNATIEREHRALTLLVKGHSQKAIALELDMSESGTSYLIRRALQRRAEALGPTIEHARVILLERYERMLERWWPLATGDYVDPESESGLAVPSKPAAEVVLKILADMAKVLGVDRMAPGANGTPLPDPDPANPPPAGDIHLHFHGEGERQKAESDILATLQRMREKQHTIDGELAKVGTTQNELTGRERNDKPGPPPRTRETT